MQKRISVSIFGDSVRVYDKKKRQTDCNLPSVYLYVCNMLQCNRYLAIYIIFEQLICNSSFYFWLLTNPPNNKHEHSKDIFLGRKFYSLFQSKRIALKTFKLNGSQVHGLPYMIDTMNLDVSGTNLSSHICFNALATLQYIDDVEYCEYHCKTMQFFLHLFENFTIISNAATIYTTTFLMYSTFSLPSTIEVMSEDLT